MCMLGICHTDEDALQRLLTSILVKAQAPQKPYGLMGPSCPSGLCASSLLVLTKATGLLTPTHIHQTLSGLRVFVLSCPLLGKFLSHLTHPALPFILCSNVTSSVPFLTTLFKMAIPSPPPSLPHIFPVSPLPTLFSFKIFFYYLTYCMTILFICPRGQGRCYLCPHCREQSLAHHRQPLNIGGKT